MFAIAGVSGNTGAVVADTLLNAGAPVRVIVRDAAKGERWSMVVSLWRPGFTHGKRLTGAVLPGDGSRSEDDTILDTTFGTGAPLGRLVLDLNTLFAGLPAPEA